MTAGRVPVGTKVRKWAERHCDAETLDTLILPAIADLQHEDAASLGRPGLVRWLIRLRGYIGLGEAVGAHLVSRRAATVHASEIAVSGVANTGGARTGNMSESNRNLLLTVGAGTLIAVVAFAAGRLSAPAPAVETRLVASPDSSFEYRALRSSLDDQRREAEERDKRIRQQLDQQAFVAEVQRTNAERARIDAETEFARQRTQQALDQKRLDEEMERTKAERARVETEMALARQRTQQLLDELSRKR
jgi:hypothetical protein